MHDYLKANDLLAVPIDKGCGFCVMKKSTYREKLDEVLNSDQFQKITGAKDDIVIKNEKQIKNSLQQLMKQGKIIDKIYQTQVNRFTTSEALWPGKGAYKRYTSPTSSFDT